ncbi:MAG: hypothetical protein NTX97_05030 [Bacteroidetes bacterium]|nr:hypothetical protein [Bacteroidota bacterium]
MKKRAKNNRASMVELNTNTNIAYNAEDKNVSNENFELLIKLQLQVADYYSKMYNRLSAY